MSAAVQPAPAGTRCYPRRRPEHALWYRLVQAHFATWLALAAGSDASAPPAYVEQALRRYLDCGILARRARRASCVASAFCKACGHDFLVAFSCQGRAVCPSCNTRRMVETAAPLVDHVLPPLPRRQWVLSVPKRLRYFLHDAAGLQGVVVRILLRAVVRRGLLEQHDRDQLGGWAHGGGFSLDATVRIAGADRAGRERLLRYCARPPFALEHLHQHAAGHLVYAIAQPRPDGPRVLVLTPLELLDQIAALVPPPRVHRHRYYGVLAPNALLRAAGTALAPVPAAAAGTPDAAPHRAAAR